MTIEQTEKIDQKIRKQVIYIYQYISKTWNPILQIALLRSTESCIYGTRPCLMNCEIRRTQKFSVNHAVYAMSTDLKCYYQLWTFFSRHNNRIWNNEGPCAASDHHESLERDSYNKFQDKMTTKGLDLKKLKRWFSNTKQIRKQIDWKLKSL